MNQTRASRSSSRGFRTDASKPTMKNSRYSSAEQAMSLGGTLAGDRGSEQGMGDGDEARATRNLKPSFDEVSSEARLSALEQDRDRTRWKRRVQ